MKKRARKKHDEDDPRRRLNVHIQGPVIFPEFLIS